MSPLFVELLEINHKLILEKMFAPSPAETLRTDDVVFDIATLEVVSMEALNTIPMASWPPRQNHTTTKETQPTKSKQSVKENKKKLMMLHASPRKHTNAQKKDK